MARWKEYLQLHFIVLIWGFTAILGLLIHIPAVELVFYRTFWAALLLVGVLYAKRRSFRVNWRPLLVIMATGGIIAGHWILFFASAKVSNASVCLAGMTTASLWTSLLEPIAFRRAVRWYEMLLGFIIILGLYVVFRFEFNHLLGLSLAVLSAFLGAAFSVINGRLVLRHDHYVITFYEMVGACLATLAFLPFYAQYLAEPPGLQLKASPMDWVYIFCLAGICTVYAYSLWVKLMRHFTPFAVNLVVNLEPVYGILLAVVIFGEREKMTPGFYIGTLIILAAVLSYPLARRYFSQRASKRKTRLATS